MNEGVCIQDLLTGFILTDFMVSGLNNQTLTLLDGSLSFPNRFKSFSPRYSQVTIGQFLIVSGVDNLSNDLHLVLDFCLMARCNFLLFTKLFDVTIGQLSVSFGLLERLLYAAHVTDWVSIGLALLTGEDPSDMHAIESLKSHLSSLQ